jgi:hypothetical protein
MRRVSSISIVACLVWLLAGASGYGRRGREAIPRGTLVKVKLLRDLSSEEAHVGDRVRVQVAEDDHSGLPPGTALVGRVTQVRRASRSHPGMLDIDFRVAELRDRWIPISGDPYSLHERDVRQTASGRLISKGRRNEGMKFIGYGALGGVLLGRILGTSTLKGALLGVAAGYLYGRSRKSDYHDVKLDRETEFGVRLNHPVVLRGGDFA